MRKPSASREYERCKHCGHLPRKLTPEQVAKAKERAHQQWLRRKAILDAAKARP
jgi:hypothetical protein